MRITDVAEIRALLETDRPWAVYALGDLATGFIEHCEWFGSPQSPAVVLLYRGFDRPVLFALGAAADVEPLLDEMGSLDEVYLHIRPEILPLITARSHVRNALHLWRMLVTADSCLPTVAADVERLALADVAALERLYATGEANGEAPDFFYPSMVERGIFFGIRDGHNIIAVAGTHLVCPQESVGAVGNVYTHPAYRGRGLAGRTSSAVTSALLALGIRTVALNVAQQNTRAIGVYERLGFARYCAFCEGIATR